MPAPATVVPAPPPPPPHSPESQWLIIPFASARSPAAAEALRGLALPQLEQLLGLLSASERDEADEFSLSPPHERALARALGWPLTDGLLPLAARWAAADGLNVATDDPSADAAGWGLLSPSHWHVGTEQVSLTDPAALQLDEPDARALFEALQPLFKDDGWQLLWGHRHRWYVRHESLARLPTASLDRVVGRNVDLWLTMHPDARLIRRLQAEVQMLLYTHPVNEAREAARLLPVNSFWLSGTGATPAQIAAPVPLTVDERLRAPALGEDWTAWAQAWAALDAGPIAALLARARAGEPVTLTLCGERSAQRFETRPRPWWRRGWLSGRVDPQPLLAGL